MAKLKIPFCPACSRSRVSGAGIQRPLLVLEASHGVSWAELIRKIRWVHPRKRDTSSKPRRAIGRTTNCGRWDERSDKMAYARLVERHRGGTSVLVGDANVILAC